MLDRCVNMTLAAFCRCFYFGQNFDFYLKEVEQEAQLFLKCLRSVRERKPNDAFFSVIPIAYGTCDNAEN